MHGFKKLISEIHRRSLWQVLGIYLAGSWVALQVVETVVEAASLPDWLPGMALVLLVIGLPVVLGTAFVQEGGPGTTIAPAPPDEVAPRAVAPTGAVRRTSMLTWRFAIGGGVAAFALWGVVATFLLLGRGGSSAEVGSGERLAIAVLPFASVGSTEDDESFALGIHDDVLTQLSKIGSLRVISRTSVMEYRDYSQNVTEIAESLGADVILEGSVQRSGDQLHINAQLIDARADEGHLWAESFDRRLTVENIFHIQGELAGRIASALNATLTPSEREEVDAAPTENMEAYTLYQRANNYFNVSPRAQDFQLAFDLFAQATEIDPGFAQAYARHALARARAFEVRPGLGGLEDARRIAELALALDENNAEAHLALGQYYYSGFRDYERSLSEIDAARAAGLSSSVDLYHNLAATQRRMGRFEEAIESFSEAVRLDPLSAHMLEDLGTTYSHVRRHAEAIEAHRKAITFAPDTGPYTFMLGALLQNDADTERAWALVEERERNVGEPAWWMHVWLHTLDRDFERAYALADSLGFRGNDIAALAARTGRPDEARRHYQNALEYLLGRLSELEASERLARFPARAGTLIDIGMAQAGLGVLDEAAASAEAAMEALPVSVDAMDGPEVLYDAAGILVAAGQLDRAVEVLEQFFTGPGEQTKAFLQIDPDFDGLRDHPGYQALLVGP